MPPPPPAAEPEHPRVAEVARLLRAAGAAGAVRHLPDSARTAAAAAAQLGVPVGAIANSLVFDVDGDPLLVMTSGAHRVDTAHVAYARLSCRDMSGRESGASQWVQIEFNAAGPPPDKTSPSSASISRVSPASRASSSSPSSSLTFARDP